MNIVVFFFIFLLLFIAYITYKSIPSSNAPPDVPFVPSKPKNALDCGLLNPKTIQKCDTDLNKCESCICSSDSSLSGCMSCTVVDEKNPYYFDFDQDSCGGDSLTWENGKCKLKNGSYCLPTKMNDIECNPYTGRKILSLNKNGKYEWKCVCVDETRFGGENCNIIKLCGLNGTTNPSRKNGVDIGLKNTKNGQYWSEKSNWSPFPDKDSGNTCVCEEGKISNDNTLTCVNDSCQPGTTNPNDPKSCKCPPPYIDCLHISQKIDDNGIPYYSGVCKIGSCIPDPCYVDGNPNNKYDKNTNMCVCDESAGYIVAQDSTNSFGQTCKKACANNGPCGEGLDKRGDCYLYQSVYDNNNLWDIVCINEGSEQQNCTTSSKIVIKNVGSGKFLGVDNTDNLILSSDSNIPSNLEAYEFNFTRDCAGEDKKCDKSIINLYSNEKYFITTSTGMYVDFNGKKIVVENEKTNALLVTLLKDAAIDRRFKLYLSAYSSYVGLDSKNMLSVKKLFGGTERCGLCLLGDVYDNVDGLCYGSDKYIDKTRCRLSVPVAQGDAQYNQDKNLLCNGSGIGRCLCRSKNVFYPNTDIMVYKNDCQPPSIATCANLGDWHLCYCDDSGLPKT